MNVIDMMRGLAWERRPDGLTLLVALAALVGAGLAVGRQATYGALLNFDAVAYIGVARNLLAGEWFIGFDGGIYISWPPLYPLLLAVASLGLFDPLNVAGALNAAIFALTIILVGRYLRRRLASRYLVAWACFAVALSMPLVELATAALTEPLFILLATLALIRMDDYLATGKRSALLWAAAFSALAWQTRYIGITVAAFIGLALLLQASVPFGYRLRRGAVFGMIAGLPMAAWLGRNYLLTGDLTAHEPPVDYSLFGLALDGFGELWEWVYFNPDWAHVERLMFLPTMSAALLLAALSAIAVGCVLARVFGGACPPDARRAIWLFGGFAAAYAAIFFFTLLVAGRPHHGVESRFLAPMYAPLVVVAAVGADRLLAFLREGELRTGAMARRLAGAALLAAITLWLATQVVPNVRAIAHANSDEFEHAYTAQPWISSDALRHIREYPMDGIVFSNHTAVVYLHNRGDAHYREPDFDALGAERSPLTLANWAATEWDGSWVAWFNENDNYEIRDKHLPQMRAMPRLHPIAEFADGAIFRVDDGYRPDAGNNPFMDAYEGIAAGDYGASAYSDFSVYWDDSGSRLLYLREPCAPQDIDARFLLHIYPSDAAVLRRERRELGFVNADFDFAAHGALFDGKCVGIAPLPGYAIERIRTGQFAGGAGAAWSVQVGPDSASRLSAYMDAYNAAIAGEYGAAAARSDFAVYRAGDALVYVKEPCHAADAEARFFLHIIPIDPQDLLAARVESGFDNLDFGFADGGAYLGGKCVAVAALPGYAIERIRTGQFVSGEGELWRVEFAGE